MQFPKFIVILFICYQNLKFLIKGKSLESEFDLSRKYQLETSQTTNFWLKNLKPDNFSPFNTSSFVFFHFF